MNKDNIRNAKTFDELLDIKYGKIGSEKRDNFEEKSKYFVISEILKEVRKEANTKDGGTVGKRFFAIQPYRLATQAAV